MKAVRRFFGLFRDSPTHERDRANLMSAVTIGATALVLNLVIVALVSPLILAPDDRDFRDLTENMEFGQLLGLILLGGATAFATLFIPLRLASVFMGPRIGRYFDQIVLSGITPFRFVIGKVTSQNLFLVLILFLLLPYFVLCLALGGLEPLTFCAGLLLVWLYCMMLAVVTLLFSLYMNELMAAACVIPAFGMLSILGSLPIPIQPLVITPFPVLLQPVYASIPGVAEDVLNTYWPLFLGTIATMSGVICAALFFIYLGPLYGIIQENSTFGEVVRKGDSKRKRWFRLRHHIQRPSEIAFFYENRSDTLRPYEGSLRWGFSFLGLSTLLIVSHGTFVIGLAMLIQQLGPPGGNWAYGFHSVCLVFHGIALVLAAIIFSHAKNCIYLRIRFFRKWFATVGRLDTVCFLIFALLSTAAVFGTPRLFEHYFASGQADSVFPVPGGSSHIYPVGVLRINAEGAVILLVAGLTVYSMLRYLSLTTWLKTTAIATTTLFYAFLFCLLPFIPFIMVSEIHELRQIAWLAEWAPRLAMASPAPLLARLFGELGSNWPRDLSPAPFYIYHLGTMTLALIGIRFTGRRVKQSYLKDSAGGAGK